MAFTQYPSAALFLLSLREAAFDAIERALPYASVSGDISLFAVIFLLTDGRFFRIVVPEKRGGGTAAARRRSFHEIYGRHVDDEGRLHGGDAG